MLSVTRHNRRDDASSTPVAKCSSSVPATPYVAICPSVGQLLKLREDVRDDAWTTDGQPAWRPPAARQSRQQHVTTHSVVECFTLSLISARPLPCVVEQFNSQNAPSPHCMGPVRAVSFSQRVVVTPFIGRLSYDRRRLIAWICCECYSSAEPVYIKELNTTRTSVSVSVRRRLQLCITNT